eukprot:709124-Rhodomonas_salina.1
MAGASSGSSSLSLEQQVYERWRRPHLVAMTSLELMLAACSSPTHARQCPGASSAETTSDLRSDRVVQSLGNRV